VKALRALARGVDATGAVMLQLEVVIRSSATGGPLSQTMLPPRPPPPFPHPLSPYSALPLPLYWMSALYRLTATSIVIPLSVCRILNVILHEEEAEIGLSVASH
jgi:hypothetical protein